MKKRTAFIGAILSLIPLGQPLIIKTGVVLSTTGLILSVPEKVNAESADFYFDRARKKSDSGDFYGAISDYTKAIEINPKKVEAYNNIAFVKRKREINDTYGAIFYATKALEIDPNYSNAYLNRGVAKKNLGDMNGACDDWRKASSLGNEYTAEWVRNQC